MSKCRTCEGWGLERDPSSADGWKRDPAGNAVPCGRCGQSGNEPGAADLASSTAAASGDLPEQRG